MDTKLEEVLAISKVLISLEEEERAIQAKISEARERLGGLIGGAAQPTVQGGQVEEGDPEVEDPNLPWPGYGRSGGYGQRGETREVLEYVRSVPGQHVSPGDVVAALGREGKNEVFSRILQRLAKAGLIERTHRGLYRFNTAQEPK